MILNESRFTDAEQKRISELHGKALWKYLGELEKKKNGGNDPSRDFSLYGRFLEALDTYYRDMYSTEHKDGYTEFVITIPKDYYDRYMASGNDLDIYQAADKIVNAANACVKGNNGKSILGTRDGFKYIITYPSNLYNYVNRNIKLEIDDTPDTKATRDILGSYKFDYTTANFGSQPEKRDSEASDFDDESSYETFADELDVGEAFSRKTSNYDELIGELNEDVDEDSVDVESLVDDVLTATTELTDKFYSGVKCDVYKCRKKIFNAITSLEEVAHSMLDNYGKEDVDEDFDLGDTLHDVAVAAAPAAVSAIAPAILAAL